MKIFTGEVIGEEFIWDKTIEKQRITLGLDSLKTTKIKRLNIVDNFSHPHSWVIFMNTKFYGPT